MEFNNILTDEGKIRILKVYEKRQQLRVKIETAYGVKDWGFSLHDRYKDEETGLPKWLPKLKRMAEKFLATKTETKEKIKREAEPYLGEYNIEDIGKEGVKPKKPKA